MRFAIRDLETWYHRPGKIAPYPEETYLIRWQGKTFWTTEIRETSDYVIAFSAVQREIKQVE